MRAKAGTLFNGPYLQLGVFAGFCLGGCLFIVIAKSMHASPFLSMAVPVALMFVFLALSTSLGRLRMHDEQTGDNLYYMGFLYTLTSLGVSLYQFGTGTSTDEVVRNFGIAISSTITGIALRIFYNQMRRDPADVERAARTELADMTRRVRTEMENVTREFADFRRISNQMLEEGFHEISVQADKNGEYIREILSKLALEAIKPIEETSVKLGEAMNQNYEKIEAQFAEIANTVGNASEILEKANSSMSASTTKFGDQAESVAEKLGKVVVPDEVLKNEVAPLVKKLGDVAALHAVRAEKTSAAQAEKLEALGKLVEQIAGSVQAAADAARKTSEIASSQEARIATMAEIIRKHDQRISNVAQLATNRALNDELPELMEKALTSPVQPVAASLATKAAPTVSSPVPVAPPVARPEPDERTQPAVFEPAMRTTREEEKARPGFGWFR